MSDEPQFDLDDQMRAALEAFSPISDETVAEIQFLCVTLDTALADMPQTDYKGILETRKELQKLMTVAVSINQLRTFGYIPAMQNAANNQPNPYITFLPQEVQEMQAIDKALFKMSHIQLIQLADLAEQTREILSQMPDDDYLGSIGNMRSGLNYLATGARMADQVREALEDNEAMRLWNEAQRKQLERNDEAEETGNGE